MAPASFVGLEKILSLNVRQLLTVSGHGKTLSLNWMLGPDVHTRGSQEPRHGWG